MVAAARAALWGVVAFAGCAAPVESGSDVGPWEPKAASDLFSDTMLLPASAPDQRFDVEWSGLRAPIRWRLMRGDEPVVSGQVEPREAWISGLPGGDSGLRLELRGAEPEVADFSVRWRRRPAFDGEPNEADSAAAECDGSGCVSILGWPADRDTFVVTAERNGGLLFRVSGVPNGKVELTATGPGLSPTLAVSPAPGADAMLRLPSPTVKGSRFELSVSESGGAPPSMTPFQVRAESTLN